MEIGSLRFNLLGMDFFCTGKKFLVYNLVSRNLKVKYRRSIFGLFWTMLSPLALAGIYYLVFQVILKVQVPHYAVFVLSGVLPWTFFAQTLVENTEAILGNWGLLSKIPIPVHIFPYVGTITNLVTLSFAIPIILVAAAISDIQLGVSLVMLFFYIPQLFLMAYGFSVVFSLAFVYFRDLKHLIGLLMQLWFYATPVIYDKSMIPEHLQWLLFLNPVGMVITGLHAVLVRGEWPNAQEIWMPMVWTALVVGFALLMLKKFARHVVERV